MRKPTVNSVQPKSLFLRMLLKMNPKNLLLPRLFNVTSYFTPRETPILK